MPELKRDDLHLQENQIQKDAIYQALEMAFSDENSVPLAQMLEMFLRDFQLGSAYELV